MKKIFLDSNILFSIAYCGERITKLHDIYSLQELKSFKIHISSLVKNEAIRNIEIKKHDNMSYLNKLFSKTLILQDVIVDLNIPNINHLPINDKIILTTSIFYKMDFFITGNSNDFKKLFFKQIGKTMILKPSDFLNKNF